jgi:hypothetical protein
MYMWLFGTLLLAISNNGFFQIPLSEMMQYDSKICCYLPKHRTTILFERDKSCAVFFNLRNSTALSYLVVTVSFERRTN